MSTTDRDRWREVIKYEVWMFGETLKMAAAPSAQNVPDGDPHRNVVTESLVLHARNLCDFCTKGKEKYEKNDIKPKDLFDEYNTAPEYSTLRDLVKDLRTAYEDEVAPPSVRTGTIDAGSSFGSFIETSFVTDDLKITPKTAFDKMLAHPTKSRDPHRFNYGPYLDLVLSKIRKLVEEIRRLENAQGRDFPSLG